MESLGLSQKDVQSRNKWRRRIKGKAANPGSPGKMAIKTECVCVIFKDGKTSILTTRSFLRLFRSPTYNNGRYFWFSCTNL